MRIASTIVAAALIGAGFPLDQPPPPQQSGLQNCVTEAIRGCSALGGAVRSVSFTGGTPEHPSGVCSFECYPPAPIPGPPAPPRPDQTGLLSVLVWKLPIPHWEIDYMRADGIWVTVCNSPGVPGDALWREVMLDAGGDP